MAKTTCESDRALYMAKELDKLSQEQKREFFKILNTEHDMRFDDIVKMVRKK